MSKQTKLTHCPICKGELQATEVREVYFTVTALTLDDSGNVLEAEDDWVDDGEATERRTYCQNDHTLDEMLAKLKS